MGIARKKIRRSGGDREEDKWSEISLTDKGERERETGIRAKMVNPRFSRPSNRPTNRPTHRRRNSLYRKEKENLEG